MRRYLIVDVFTDTPLEGNQLAVFPEAGGLSPGRMQQMAREMNLSESVFVLPPEGGGDARIRIFTPTQELPFAGHPTLGCAFALCGQRDLDAIALETGVGIIRIEFDAQAGQAQATGLGPAGQSDPAGQSGPAGESGLAGPERQAGQPGLPGWMGQPVPTWELYDQADAVLAAVGVGSSLLPVEAYHNGPRYAYVALDSEDAVERLRPDIAATRRLPGIGGAVCFGGSGEHWKMRCFLPALGIAEDPATGSAAGPLAVHLARHGWTGFGQQIEVRQGAEVGRPSVLLARAEGEDDKIVRVSVGGSAVIIARGEFLA